MRRLRNIAVVVAGVALGAPAASWAEPKVDIRGHEEGSFAHAGYTAYVFGGLPSRTIPAPRGSAAVKVAEDKVMVEGKSGEQMLEGLNTLPNPEILWAPHGRAFTVTDSAQGVVGWWRTHLYLLDEADKPVPQDINALVAPWYKTFAACKYHENANFFAGAWLDGGEELLIVIAAPDHSTCTNMGHFSGLRVSLPRWVVAEAISEEDLVKRYGDKLGQWFRAVPEGRAAASGK
jgi:hypothetical protein